MFFFVCVVTGNTPRRPPKRIKCPQGTKLWSPPAFATQFWSSRRGFGAQGAVLAPVYVFVRLKKSIHQRGKWNKTVNWTISNNFCFILFPPLMNWFFLVLQKWKRVPKPLLGHQNWVTKAGGRHNLVPRWHLLRRVGGRGGAVCHIHTLTRIIIQTNDIYFHFFSESYWGFF